MKLRACVVSLCLTAVIACDREVDLNASVLIEHQVGYDSDCRLRQEFPVPVGTWDIGSKDSPADCSHSYRLSLAVSSPLAPIETFSEAKVWLNSHGGPIPTWRDQLPNPMLIQLGYTKVEGESMTLGWIPEAYIESVREYAGQDISIEASVLTQVESGRLVETPIYEFPVTICEGCLSYCRSDIEEGATLEGPHGPVDTACSYEGRATGDFVACVDPDC